MALAVEASVALRDPYSGSTWIIPRSASDRSAILSASIKEWLNDGTPIDIAGCDPRTIGVAVDLLSGGPDHWRRIIPILGDAQIGDIAGFSNYLEIRAQLDASIEEAAARYRVARDVARVSRFFSKAPHDLCDMYVASLGPRSLRTLGSSTDPSVSGAARAARALEASDTPWFMRRWIEVPVGPGYVEEVEAGIVGRIERPGAHFGPITASERYGCIAAAVRLDSVRGGLILATWNLQTGEVGASHAHPQKDGAWPTDIRFATGGRVVAICRDEIVSWDPLGIPTPSSTPRAVWASSVTPGALVLGIHPRRPELEYAVETFPSDSRRLFRYVTIRDVSGRLQRAPVCFTGRVDPGEDILPLDGGLLFVQIEDDLSRCVYLDESGTSVMLRVEWPEPIWESRILPIESSSDGAPWFSPVTGHVYRAARRDERLSFERIATIPEVVGASSVALLAPWDYLAASTPGGTILFVPFSVI